MNIMLKKENPGTQETQSVKQSPKKKIKKSKNYIKPIKVDPWHRFQEFWIDVFVKIIRTLISVKVWGLIGVPAFSTVLLIKGYLDSADWTTVNTTTISVIYGMREFFKISNLESTEKVVNYERSRDEEYYDDDDYFDYSASSSFNDDSDDYNYEDYYKNKERRG